MPGSLARQRPHGKVWLGKANFAERLALFARQRPLPSALRFAVCAAPLPSARRCRAPCPFAERHTLPCAKPFCRAPDVAVCPAPLPSAPRCRLPLHGKGIRVRMFSFCFGFSVIPCVCKNNIDVYILQPDKFPAAAYMHAYTKFTKPIFYKFTK